MKELRKQISQAPVIVPPPLLASILVAVGCASVAVATPLERSGKSPWHTHSGFAAPLHDGLANRAFGRAERRTAPHPAVARIIVPEGNSMSYGSGTLVDVRDQFGLVVTNWHVVRDASGPIDVVFPTGFRSSARALKIDPDWDLAALVIWRPPITPVPLATRAPRAGDRLTICGYGSGEYRSATGLCTQYYAPRPDFPQEMVELSVQARQGDSGGPILNHRGELAGVLFGAGEGTTIGSFGGRVEWFLASLTGGESQASGTRSPQRLADGSAASPGAKATATVPLAELSGPRPVELEVPAIDRQRDPAPSAQPNTSTPVDAVSAVPLDSQTLTWTDLVGRSGIERTKSLLALVGVVALGLLAVRCIA